MFEGQVHISWPLMKKTTSNESINIEGKMTFDSIIYVLMYIIYIWITSLRERKICHINHLFGMFASHIISTNNIRQRSARSSYRLF